MKSGHLASRLVHARAVGASQCPVCGTERVAFSFGLVNVLVAILGTGLLPRRDEKTIVPPFQCGFFLEVEALRIQTEVLVCNREGS